MTVKGQIERIERTIKGMRRSVRELTDEELKRAIVSRLGLPEDILQSECEVVVRILSKNPDWPTLANPDYPTSDDRILSHLRDSALQLGDLNDFTDEELLTRFHGYLDKVQEHF